MGNAGLSMVVYRENRFRENLKGDGMPQASIFQRWTCYLLAAFFVAVLVAQTTHPARALEQSALFTSFDARGLVPEEKRLLQSALAVQGYYNGLLDGKWGRGSQAAIERYTLERFDGEPLNIHMATLVIDFANLRETAGWEMVWRQREGVSFAAPLKILKPQDRNGYRVWESIKEDLTILLKRGDIESALAFQQFVEGEASQSRDTYHLRLEGVMVTSSLNAEGKSFYVRSELVNGFWTTVIVIGDNARRNEVNGIATSISFGAPADWIFPKEGLLSAMVELAIDTMEAARASDKNVENRAENGSEGNSGTGFFVSDRGEILTNAHVVTGCARMEAGRRSFRIAAVDSHGDLALLRPETRFVPEAVAAFAAAPARLNADLTVVGYPLHGILGGLNVTRGTVTSASGLGGDSTTMQISAPVQPGNSGGPVIDAYGLVTGVVVSKLDAIKIAGAIGDLPQNVNFAIRGEVAKLFLSVHGVDFRVGLPSVRSEPSSLAEAAARFTILLECRVK
jgi:serine protease Do